jgi:hypothetical protein
VEQSTRVAALSGALWETGFLLHDPSGMATTYLLSAAGVLFVACVLFMRNTHPFSGSRSEKFESKQLRRRIGIICLILSAALVTIAILAYGLISKG